MGRPRRSTLFPYTTLFRSLGKSLTDYPNKEIATKVSIKQLLTHTGGTGDIFGPEFDAHRYRSEEHTSELQSLRHLVCRLLLEKKKTGYMTYRKTWRL